ncbi:formyltransferase family protein [Helicobacter mesocricetorum]|uniref:formyltransferase family protein n=1 Tax=Helicobacter mesocricetorum TaxID=87012 RepID=UPI001F2CEFB7|nr:formyltransferase family protein [Helicobacter mesocricetorum]
MKKVVFLGAKEIGRKCLAEVFARQKELDFTLLSVGTSPRGEGVRAFCMQHKIPMIADLDELLKLDFDILFCVQYHQILQLQHILCAKEIALNLHLAPLPEYRGCNQFSFAILNEDKEFGVSIHKIDSGIDSGDIAFEKRFLIPKDCFVEELVELASEYGFRLFANHLKQMIKGEYRLMPQKEIYATKREFHLRNEINALKEVNLHSCGGGGFN